MPPFSVFLTDRAAGGGAAGGADAAPGTGGGDLQSLPRSGGEAECELCVGQGQDTASCVLSDIQGEVKTRHCFLLYFVCIR